MRRPFSIAAAALLLAVNAWVLAGVARNRLGEPDATLTLSERELEVRRSTGREDSGVWVRLEVDHSLPVEPFVGRNSWTPWLPPQRLAEFGFDLALPANLDEAYRKWRHQPPRRGWAVVQFGGRPWEEWKATLLAAAKELDRKFVSSPDAADARDERSRIEHQLRAGSRLFMVDAGPDASALRATYADRSSFLILPAEIRVDVSVARGAMVCAPKNCNLAGRVSLLTDELQVPRHLQQLLPPVPPTPPIGTEVDPPPQRFVAVIRSGARREPWLEAIRPGSPAGADAREAGAR